MNFKQAGSEPRLEEARQLDLWSAGKLGVKVVRRHGVKGGKKNASKSFYLPSYFYFSVGAASPNLEFLLPNRQICMLK